MNINNVFLAYTLSDNEEKLLYKDSNGRFIDLLTEKVYSSEEIDMDTIIPYNKSIISYNNPLFGYAHRRVVNDFINDRARLLEVKKFYIVSIAYISNLRTKEEIDGHSYTFNVNRLYRTILERTSSNNLYSANIYLDIRTNREIKGYDSSELENGLVYVHDKKSGVVYNLSSRFPERDYVEKRKILKLAYQLKKDSRRSWS